MSERRPTAALRRVLGRWTRIGARLHAPFPVVDGNALIVRASDDLYAPMAAAIDTAARSIDVEMYMWDVDEIGCAFAESLAAAARRGVRVRVLADDFGARDALAGPLRATAEAGADVRAFNPLRLPLLRPYVHRTHKKLLLVDGERGFCGGAGFSRHFSAGISRRNPASAPPWLDRMYEVRGPVVAQLAQVFEADFTRWRVRRPIPPPACPQCVIEVAGDVRARVLRGWPDSRDFTRQFLRAVLRARTRIWIGTPYFLPPFALRRALRRAARRGVDVQVVVPAYEGASAVLWYASRRHYGGFLRSGARIHEFGPAFYHAKTAVVDDDHAFVGSSNMDSLSWRTNAELDLVVHDAATVETVADLLVEDRRGAREVTLDDHRSRGTLHRVFERAAGLLDRWL